MNKFIKILLLLLRLALGCFFIISAWLKIYPIEMLELSIAEFGIFNWAQSTYIARLLIGFEFFVGLMLIFKVFKKTTFIATLTTLIIFTLYLAYLAIYKPELTDCGCMGFNLPISPINSIYKNLLLVAALVVVWIFENRFEIKWINNLLNNKWIAASSLIIAFALPFILNPINIAKANKIESNELITTNINLDNDVFFKWNSSDTFKMNSGKKIICFFSPRCRFCKMSARKINVFLKKQTFPVYFVFAGNTSSKYKLKNFYAETNTENIPTTIISEERFFNICSPYLPEIFFVNEHKIINKENFISLSDYDVYNFFKL